MRSTNRHERSGEVTRNNCFFFGWLRSPFVRFRESFPFSATCFIAVAIILSALAGLVTTAVYADRVIAPESAAERTYTEEIAKTYDFKFGANPFAPSNATSVTGTFIPAEKFVASTRCGAC